MPGTTTTGDRNIVIGNVLGFAGESNTIRIGESLEQIRAFIAGIRGATMGLADAITVVVDSAGQLGTINSSRRVKDDIADMGAASDVLMKLRPVTFHYKSDRNSKGRALQYGLIAEEVAAVAPGLVARSATGEIETVYYQHLAPMLLNEYQNSSARSRHRPPNSRNKPRASRRWKNKRWRSSHSNASLPCDRYAGAFRNRGTGRTQRDRRRYPGRRLVLR